MSPRKKATSTQERLEKALKKATKEPKKEKASGVKKEVYKTKAKRGLGRNAEADDELSDSDFDSPDICIPHRLYDRLFS